MLNSDLFKDHIDNLVLKMFVNNGIEDPICDSNVVLTIYELIERQLRLIEPLNDRNYVFLRSLAE